MKFLKSLTLTTITFIVLFAATLQIGCSDVRLGYEIQVPIYTSLTPFMIFDGYYLNLRNTSDSDLKNVYIKYYDKQGKSVTQTIGSIPAKSYKQIDPSDVRWTILKHEEITVHADGFIRRHDNTNIMIDQL